MHKQVQSYISTCLQSTFPEAICN